jgi:hypothetical protein
MAKMKPATRNDFAFTVALGIRAGNTSHSQGCDQGARTAFTTSKLDSARRRPHTVTFDAEPYARSHIRQRRSRGRIRV